MHRMPIGKPTSWRPRRGARGSPPHRTTRTDGASPSTLSAGIATAWAQPGLVRCTVEHESRDHVGGDDDGGLGRVRGSARGDRDAGEGQEGCEGDGATHEGSGAGGDHGSVRADGSGGARAESSWWGRRGRRASDQRSDAEHGSGGEGAREVVVRRDPDEVHERGGEGGERDDRQRRARAAARRLDESPRRRSRRGSRARRTHGVPDHVALRCPNRDGARR